MFPSAIPATRLLLLTGHRKNEIVTLKRGDMDRTADELGLSDSKTADSNTITIPRGFL